MNLPATPLRIGIAVGDHTLQQFAHRALHGMSLGMPTEPIFGNVDEVVQSVARLQPFVLVTDLEALGPQYGDTIRRLRAAPAPPDVIVLHDRADGEIILKAMRAGAREFLFEDITAALRETVIALSSDSQACRQSGKVYAFFSAKGGCGSTTIACYAAAALARDSKRSVVLADLDWSSPGTAFLLREKPQHYLQSALSSMGRMDRGLWNAMATETKYGFTLAPPPLEEDTGSKDADSLTALLRFLKAQYGDVVADCGSGSVPLLHDLTSAADEIVVVSTTEITALHHAKRLLGAIRERCGSDRLRLVLNRVDKRPELTTHELENMLGHPILTIIPNEYRALNQACQNGKLLPPEHSFSETTADLVAQLSGSTPVQKKKRFPLFGK